MLVAQVFASLVTVQNARRRVFAQCIEQCFVGEFAAMPGTEPPSDNLSGFEVEHNGQIAPGMLKLEICEVLHPGSGSGHAFVAHTVLRSGFVFERRIALLDNYYSDTTRTLSLIINEKPLSSFVS